MEVVQELLLSRLFYVYEELTQQMQAVGVPPLCIPNFEITRFGSNAFFIGFINEPYRTDWIETFRPEINSIPMNRMPWLDSYIMRLRYRPPRPRTNWIHRISTVVQSICHFFNWLVHHSENGH